MTTTKKAPAKPKPTPTVADELVTFLRRFIYLPLDVQYDVLALYVLHTWAFDAFKVTPYIYVNSAERGSGKTTLLELLHEVCSKAKMGADISAAALYAMVEDNQPTLLIDEVDAVFSGPKNEDMRGMLNSGYNSRGSVIRNTGISKNEDDPGYREFSTFCPKVMAGIDNGQLPDTVADRSIVITLKRANAAQYAAIEPFYQEDEEDTLAELQSKIQAWVGANMDKLVGRDNRPARLDALGPRQNQIAAPLLTIAARLGNGWFDRAKVALIDLLAAKDARLSAQATALLRVREWFVQNPAEDRISSAKVAEITEANGKQIGIWFNAYGITPATLRFDGVAAKGYRKADFTDSFDRYLPTTD